VLTRDFDYDLPANRVAQRPEPRGESRLLVADLTGADRHRRISDLPSLLRAGDLLVVNNTKVIPARLFGRRQETGGRIELLLVERTGDRDWTALLKPGRRARPGTVIELSEGLDARVKSKESDGRHHVRFSEPIEPHLDRLGHVPLPPYIKREDEPDDRSTYQTVYASEPGAIAAPTAGLHFSEALLEQLEVAEVRRAELTLHVGIGTFKPVTAALVHEHRMESERYSIPPETANAIRHTRASGGRIVAVGTTAVRALEAAATGDGQVATGAASTRLFITPGFHFQIVDVLLTNFHLPQSTLLMLVSAFAGRQRVMDLYEEAIEEGYRFYSYGDAMLVKRHHTSNRQDL